MKTIKETNKEARDTVVRMAVDCKKTVNTLYTKDVIHRVTKSNIDHLINEYRSAVEQAFYANPDSIDTYKTINTTRTALKDIEHKLNVVNGNAADITAYESMRGYMSIIDIKA